MSVLRAVRKRKKVRKLGSVNIIRREAYADLELDAKVELIRSLVPLGLMHVQELLDEEVTALARERYARKDASVAGRRHGSNPGTVGLAGQRVPIRVPHSSPRGQRAFRRVRRCMATARWTTCCCARYGISCRNYEAAAAVIPGAIEFDPGVHPGQRSCRAFQERDLSGEDVVAVCDGKTFADANRSVGIALGRNASWASSKRTRRRHGHAVPAVVGRAGPRCVLVILDGGKGCVRKAFRNRALVQRCQWHKRENVVSTWPSPRRCGSPARARCARDAPRQSNQSAATVQSGTP